MATNISNLPISSSFQDLVLESGSILQNATGSVINNLTITSSFAITASHATNVPDTASFAVRATSASMADSASYAVSASVEIVKEVSSSYADVAGLAQSVAGGDVSGAVASASFAETASFLLGSVSTASYALSSSVATLADSASNATRAVSASMADSSSYAVLASDSRDLIIGVKSSQATTILKGQTLHATGVTGENINVVTASNDNSANMPAIAVANENINAGATSTAVISGKIIGIDTDGLVAGANVYVDVNGGITGTKPTGTALIQNIGVVGKIDAVDGELVVLGSGRSNDLPNITSGYAWVGNENQVPIAVSTASFAPVTASYAVSASVASNADSASNATNAVTASHTAGTASFADNANSSSVSVNATSASVATNADSASNADRAVTASIADDIKQDINVVFNTGSFQLLTAQSASIGFLQSITGSAKIIGDAFIILNNDLPAERFAGIKVIDTGSTDATASLIWDGNTNDWKYDFSASGDADSAVVLFGPHADTITDTRYPENNYLLKGTGTHHLASSSIVDNASTITIGNTTTFSNGASGSFSGSFEGDGGNLTNLNLDATASWALSASVALTAITASHVVTASFADSATSASQADNASSASQAVNAATATSASFAESSSFAEDARTADSALTASNVNELNQDVYITGSLKLSGSLVGTSQQFSLSTGQTASLDTDNHDFFEIFLPAGGGNAHVTLANTNPYQVINTKVIHGSTTATSMSWDSNYFRFPAGIEVSGSASGSAVDMYSFASFADQKYLGTVITSLQLPASS